jgi:hypothetical protein
MGIRLGPLHPILSCSTGPNELPVVMVVDVAVFQNPFDMEIP